MKPIIRSGFILFGALLFSMSSFSQVKNKSITKSTKKLKMDNQIQDRNKATICKLYENILNTGKLDMLNQIISEEYIGVRGEKGAPGFAETVNSIRLGFPDIK